MGTDWNTNTVTNNNQVIGFRALLAKFRIKERPFDHPNFNINITDDPFAPWKWLKQFPEFVKFAEFVLQILKIPTGIAAVERSFSPVRRFHTWQRANLDPQTLDHLVYVYFNLKSLGEC